VPFHGVEYQNQWKKALISPFELCNVLFKVFTAFRVIKAIIQG